MPLVVTVDGVDRTSGTRRFEARRAINGVGAATFVFVDRSGSLTPWIPQALDEVVVAIDGTPVFRGRVLTVAAEFTVRNRPGFVTTTCEVADVNDRLGQELLNTAATGGTLKSVLQHIVLNLSAQGVQLDPLQADGPTVEDQLFAWVTCREALDHLAQLTGWIYRLDEQATPNLSMWSIGSRSAGVALSEANRNIERVAVAQDATGYRNIQWLVYGPTQDGVPIEEVFDCDGVQRSFPFSYQLNGGTPPTVVTRSDTGATVPCGPDTGWEWSYDAGNNRVVQTGGTPVANGATLTVPYVVGFPQYIARGASDIGYPNEVTENGRWMRRDEAPEVFDFVQARATADALIRVNRPRPQRLTVVTRASGIDPGELVSVTLPELGVATADFLVQAVVMRYEPAPAGHRVEYDLELVGGVDRQADWTTFWRDLLGGRGGGGGTVSGGVGVGGTTLASAGAAFLGGSEAALVTGATPGLVPEGVAVELDSAAYPSGAVTVRCELRTTNAATGVRARLVCLDDLSTRGESDEVTSVGVPPGRTGWTRVKFAATLVAGVKWYALYVVPSNGSSPVQARGAYLA